MSFFVKSPTPGNIAIGLDGVDPDAAGVAPAFTSPPAWVGGDTAQVGEPMAFTSAIATGAPAPTIAYSLVRDGTPIAGAITSPYTPVEADEGLPIQVRATASNNVGSPAVSDSVASDDVVSVAPADVTSTEGFSTTAGYYSTDASLNEGSTAMSAICMFTYKQHDSGNLETMHGKGGGSSQGWGMGMDDSDLFRVSQFGTVELQSNPFTPIDVGKTFVAIWVRHADYSRLYLARESDRSAVLVDSDESPGSVTASGARGYAVGAYQSNTGGNLALPCTHKLIGVGVAPNTTWSAAQIQEMAKDCIELGHVPTDLPGASVYNAATGLDVDVSGNDNNLVVKDTGGNLVTETASASYAGQVANLYVIWGQSLARGTNTLEADYEDIASTDWTAAYSAVQYSGITPGLDWIDLQGTGDGVTGLELSMGRGLSEGGVERVFIDKYAIGSTDLASDWLPPSGANFTTAIARVREAIGYLHQLDKPRLRGIHWNQGESDADDAMESGAYQDNLGTLYDYIESELSDVLSDDWQFQIRLMSIAAQTHAALTHIATVKAGQIAFAATKSNVFTIDCEAYVCDDGVHANAPSQIGTGTASAASFLSASNVTMAQPS